ncbi:hypothetical protein FQA39_LY03232 [Lamprigera yunnana]|nr:hypothetical protein FQA39_LY03232 [Lamprigera yunnana]
MADYSHIPNFHLKVVFIIHFILTSMAGIGYWTPPSYVFYNFVLIIVLLWSIHRSDTAEPLQFSIFINGTSIILDVLTLTMRFPDSHSASERFSAALAIILLLVRPATTFYLIRLFQERHSSDTGNFFPSSHNRNYEDMDKNIGPPAEAQMAHQGGYDFSNAQQI